jgi:hypothetical protein
MEKQFSETLNKSGVAVFVEAERIEEGYANAKTEVMTKVDNKSTLLNSHPEIK